MRICRRLDLANRSRNPNEGPDSDWGGFNFWLHKLNENGGDFHRAEMVKAFLDAIEYRNRFEW